MKQFKLIVLLCLVVVMALTAVACGGPETTGTTAATTTEADVTTAPAETTAAPTETTPVTTTAPVTTPAVVTTPATPETTGPAVISSMKIGETPISDYVIVYAKSPYEVYTKIADKKPYFPVYDFDHESANRLSDLIFAATGVRLKVVQDTKTTATANEILVGETNRTLTGGTDISKLKSDDYVVNVVGTKLVICGGEFGTTWHALDYLEAQFAEKLANKETAYTFGADYAYAGTHHLTVIGCIGDSITQGVGASNQEMFSYPAQMGRLLWKDAIVHNFGDSGSTMRNDHGDAYTKTTPYQNAVRAAATVDIFTIMLGTNDSDRFRTWTDNDTEVYKKDCLALMETLKKKNADINFVLANCPAYFGGGSFGSAKMRQIQASLLPIVNEAGYPTTFYDTYTATKTLRSYFPDSLHPNDMGHLKMAQAFAEYLQTLITPATPEAK